MKNITYLSFIILSLILTLNSYGQSFLVKPDTLKNKDEKLISLINTKPILTLLVDFTGDKKLDFICRVKSDNIEKGEIKEVWIDHYYKIIKTIYRRSLDYNYYWFVNLDSDPVPEICSIFGYSDGINYAFYKQDLKNGVDNLLFYFNPIIIDSTQEKKIYWGYPWDIKDLKLKLEKGIIKVLCSLDHDIKLDSEVGNPNFQRVLPVICFNGKSSQPGVHVGEIRNIKWLSVKEIKKNIIIQKK